MYIPEFLVQELQQLIPSDIHRLYDTSKKNRSEYNEYRKLKYWKFNTEYSFKYCNDNEFYIKDEIKKDYSIVGTINSLLGYKIKPTGKTFYEYINSKIDTKNKLSIKIHDKTIENMNRLGKVHTVKITKCKTNKWHNSGVGINLCKTNTWDITDLGNLHSLYLSRYNESGVHRYNKLTLIGIKNLGNLHTLDLSYTQVSDEDVIHLGKVHTLNISNNYTITNNCIKHLGNVHTLNVSHCNNITDEGVKHLGKVNTLNLSYCNGITYEGTKYLGNCDTLNLNGCKNITDVSFLCNVNKLILGWDGYSLLLPRGLKQFNNIYLLDLKRNKDIIDENLKEFVNVHSLNLSNCYNITDVGIKYLGNVHTLNVSRCRKIMNGDLKWLKNCNTLDLSYCEKISNEGLKYLENCDTLNLFGCNDITDVGLMYLKKCKKICLDISFTKNISINCINKLGNIYIENGRTPDYEPIWKPFKNVYYPVYN